MAACSAHFLFWVKKNYPASNHGNSKGVFCLGRQYRKKHNIAIDAGSVTGQGNLNTLTSLSPRNRLLWASAQEIVSRRQLSMVYMRVLYIACVRRQAYGAVGPSSCWCSVIMADARPNVDPKNQTLLQLGDRALSTEQQIIN